MSCYQTGSARGQNIENVEDTEANVNLHNQEPLIKSWGTQLGMHEMSVEWVGVSGNSLVLGLEPHPKRTGGLGVIAAGKEFVADAEAKAPRM